MNISERLKRLEQAARVVFLSDERPAAVLAIQRIHADQVASSAAIAWGHAQMLGWDVVRSMPAPSRPAEVAAALAADDPEAALRQLIFERVGITIF